MAVTSVHIYYTGDTAYDLRKVLTIVDAGGTPAQVMVYFENCPNAPVQFAKAAFEAAKQASLNGGG
jgi:hypothetical protein